mmetsp:Transcript_29708/g.76718  ORF Transcript_29708/g.76718 Transcript_29708/m.76718 type:complete len:135 (-) Transcript_29708:291-695(-)|eukprot:CAMPEP_0113902792 /NCGR_PEP_ID=MMETSP0780_2-20120614/22065_1 /TAXON_ID=652834 /ORGANISM="Palpitomonas bilix" /LENGTH=134 /DNA_ID=CAMNT_0000895673 /DNA_START=151 /DNA_END=555 /DNA_ORIENTATION=- /assembly_acc=CAM_ASM_000599
MSVFSWLTSATHEDSSVLKEKKEEGHTLNAEYEQLLEKKAKLEKSMVRTKHGLLDVYSDLINTEKSQLDHIRLQKNILKRKIQYLRFRREQIRQEHAFVRTEMNHLAHDAGELLQLEDEVRRKFLGESGDGTLE